MQNKTSNSNSQKDILKIQENTSTDERIEKQLEELDNFSKISAYSCDLNFNTNSPNKFTGQELNINSAENPENSENFEQDDISDQNSTISELTITGTTPENDLDDKKYKEENFVNENKRFGTHILKSGTTACLRGSVKYISSKWSFLGAAAIAVYDVSGVFRLYKEGKIKGLDFAKHVGRAATSTASCALGADLGFKAGVILGTMAGVATGGVGIIAAGIFGAFFGGCVGSLLSEKIYDLAVDIKSEEELKILSSKEYYLKALGKYEADENTSMDDLRKKRKDFIRLYHPDKFIDQGLKEKFAKKLIAYLQFFEIIRVYRGEK